MRRILSIAFSLAILAAAAQALPVGDGCAFIAAPSPSAELRIEYESIDPRFRLVSSSFSISLDEFFSRLVSEYVALSYSRDEISTVLRDLGRMAGAGESGSCVPVVASSPCSVPDGSDKGDVLVLFVDPSCEYCRDVAELLIKTQKRCPKIMPLVDFRLAPSRDQISLQTALELEKIKIGTPSAFCGALFDAMNNVHSEAGLAVFKKQYAALADESSVLPSVKEFESCGEIPPFGIYRGRILKRIGTFNAFATETEVLYSIAVIRGMDGAGGANVVQGCRNE